MINICRLLKNELNCDILKEFSDNITTGVNLKLKDGIGELSNYTGENDDYIKICISENIECDEINKISRGAINDYYKLISSNQFNFKYEFINSEFKNITILNNINITMVSNENKAFNLFKNNPANYIFIVPDGTSAITKDNSSIYLKENFNILIYIYKPNELDDIDDIDKIMKIEAGVINVLNPDYNFINSEFVFNTNLTIIKRLNFDYDRYVELTNEECYQLELENPNCIN